MVPIGVGRMVQEGSDVTLVGWGGQVHVLTKVQSLCMCGYVYITCVYFNSAWFGNSVRRVKWLRRTESVAS